MSKTRLRFAIGLMAALVMTLAGIPNAQAAPSTTIVLTLGQQRAAVNGETVALDTAPVLDPASSRTFVPVRFVGEALGAYIGWEQAAQRVTYLAGDSRIQLTIGQKTAQVNGRAVTLDAAPYIDPNGRTLVPVRFVSEQLGATVGWDAATKAVTITAPWVGRVVVLQNAQFSPANLTVAVGTRITWVNLDRTEHDVFGAFFESPTMTDGQAYSYTFEKAGEFLYGCTFHDGMTATITVK